MPNNAKIYKSLFREICECNAQIISARLSAAGLSDISWKELLVLAALSLGRMAETDLRRELEFSGSAIDEITGELVLRGHLKNQVIRMAVTVRWIFFPSEPAMLFPWQCKVS